MIQTLACLSRNQRCASGPYNWIGRVWGWVDEANIPETLHTKWEDLVFHAQPMQPNSPGGLNEFPVLPAPLVATHSYRRCLHHVGWSSTPDSGPLALAGGAMREGS